MPAVRAERQRAAERAAIRLRAKHALLERSDDAAACDVPEMDGHTALGGGEQMAVGMKPHAHAATLVPGE